MYALIWIFIMFYYIILFELYIFYRPIT